MAGGSFSVALIVATVGWSLTVFGMGVYIHVLSEQRGFSIALISEAVTVSYLVSAGCLISVGTAVARLGPKPVIAAGVTILALSGSSIGVLPAWLAGLRRFRRDGSGPLLPVADLDQHGRSRHGSNVIKGVRFQRHCSAPAWVE